MKERPIIFSGEIVKAILDGRCTQTRRVIKPQPLYDEHYIGGWYLEQKKSTTAIEIFNKGLMRGCCPYGQVGDRLWVRETWAVEYVYDNHKPRDIPQRARVYYKNQDLRGIAFVGKWRPSIFMPRWASRILLEITGVGVERVQEITEEDCKAEGIDQNEPWGFSDGYINSFGWLWDSLNAKRGYGWLVNPWVWVIRFRRLNGSR